MEIDFTGVEAPTSDFAERAEPGVYPNMTITGMEFGVLENEKKTPYALVTVVADSKQHRERFFLSPKALPKLWYLLTTAGVSEDALSSKTTAETLARIAVGKQFHGRLNGREYINNKGERAIAAEFPFSGFAQPVSEECTLTFDPTKNIKLLPTTGTDNSVGGGANDILALDTPSTGNGKSETDLPF